MKKLFEISNSERERIIKIHEESSSKQYLNLLNEDEEQFKPSPSPDFGYRLDRDLIDDVINRLLDRQFGEEYKQKLVDLNSQFEPTQHKRIKREYEPLPPNIKVMRSLYPKD